MGSLWLVSLALLFLSSCATATHNLPALYDTFVERFVWNEAQPILAIEHTRPLSEYKFRLTDKTIGASVGDGEIYVNYTIAKQAMTGPSMRWLLRLTLAHELAHDALGHRANKQALTAILSGTSVAGQIISHAPGVIGLAGSLGSLVLGLVTRGTYELYSRTAELNADRKGIEYFKKLGWDCRVWTRLFDRLLEKGHRGDFHHPTEERLNQALDLCLSKNHPERVAIEKRLEERWRKQQEEEAGEGDSRSNEPIRYDCSSEEYRRQYPLVCEEKQGEGVGVKATPEIWKPSIDPAELPEAERYYNQQLTSAIKAYGPEHVVYGEAAYNLGEVYHAKGWYGYGPAETLYKLALAIRKKFYGSDHPSVGLVFYSIGALYHAQGRHTEAKKLYEFALAILEAFRGPHDSKVINIRRNLEAIR